MNIKKLIDDVAMNSKEDETRFNGYIMDCIGSFDVGEIVEDVETAFAANASEIKAGRIRPLLEIRVNQHSAKEASYVVRPDRTIDRNTNPPSMLLFLTIRNPKYPDEEVSVNSKETHAIARTLANRIINKMRNDNPEVTWDEDHGRIQFF